MIRPLRKRHFFVWLGLGIALPVFFFLSLPSGTNTKPATKFSTSRKEYSGKELLDEIQRQPLIVKLWQELSEKRLKQFEVVINESINSPSAHLYLSLTNEENPVSGSNIWIQPISEIGRYVIQLDSLESTLPQYHFAVYDNITKEFLLRFELSSK